MEPERRQRLDRAITKREDERCGQAAGVIARTMYADHPLVKAIEQGGNCGKKCPPEAFTFKEFLSAE